MTGKGHFEKGVWIEDEPEEQARSSITVNVEIHCDTRDLDRAIEKVRHLHEMEVLEERERRAYAQRIIEEWETAPRTAPSHRPGPLDRLRSWFRRWTCWQRK